MKKIVTIGLSLFFLLIFLPSPSYGVNGLDYYEITQTNITPIPCGTTESRSCPKEMLPIYEELGEKCSESFEEFREFPTTQHFWIEDPEITAQGKANERARQFIYWAVNNRAIDDHPVLRQIWQLTSSVALFFVGIVVAFFAIGIIISRRTNFNLNLQVWPSVIKIIVMLLYIMLSASIILLLIQLSEIMMRFFIDNLGGRDLFNIYFSNSGNLGSSERNYIDFVGCRDLNLRVQESVDAKMIIYRITNITYYIMGVMILLRKILLWFLLFVAPFLALLMPFVFIRNIGWIWIGVFFQWLMYGPLFALFLGALSRIWKAGIPFTFDFSRVNDPSLTGYTYPTAMNILYGGPGQVNDKQLSALNSGSYVDTFTEYVITLIMLWAVTFFPWWLLRIFRDYCCDGIYAMRNVLFAMYDQMRGGPPKSPGPSPKFPGLKTSIKVPDVKVDVTDDRKREKDKSVSIKLESMEQIRKASTHDISKSLDMRVSKLTDIAKMETNKQSTSTLQQRLANLSNPAKAQTQAERQQYMNLRTELFNRAIKQDSLARTILASTSNSAYERSKVRESLMKDIAEMRASLLSNAASASSAVASSQSASSSRASAAGRGTSTSERGATSAGRGASASDVRRFDRQSISSVQKDRAATVSLSKDSLAQISKIADISNDQTKQVLDKFAKTNERTMNRAVMQLSKEMNISAEKIRTAIQQSTKIQVSKANTVMSKYMNRMASSTKMVSTISQRTGLKQSEIRSIIKAYVESMNKPANQVVNNISNVTNISQDKVKSTMHQMGNTFYTKNLILDFSEEHEVDAEQVENALNKTATSTSTGDGGDSPEVGGPGGGGPEQPTSEEQEVEVEAQTTEKGKEAEAGEVGTGGEPGPSPQPTGVEQELAQQFAKEALEDDQFVEQNNITPPHTIEDTPVIIKSVIHIAHEDNEAANDIVREVAKEEQVTEEEATELVQEQLQIAAEPEKNIEKIVEVPKSISIEEYEDLKTMWTEQYENGEIPVTENMQSREEWVEADIVTITNVMNKILSPNEDLQQQGLDELGFIIPIFMINNLKGEQLITYLKAKLEAAKSVKKLLDKEREIREKLQREQEEDEDNLVELKKKKKEEKPKAMHMDLDEEKGPTTIEERAQVEAKPRPEVNEAYLSNDEDKQN
ncbi:MAG: hypothetical protein ACOCXQ_02580 [Patescibacteria group bacterium]